MRLLTWLGLGLVFALPAKAIYVDGGIECYPYYAVIAQAETSLDFWDVWDGWGAAAVYVGISGPQYASAQDSAWYPDVEASATATVYSPPTGTYGYDAMHYFYDSWTNNWYGWQGPASSCGIGGGGALPQISGIAVYPQSSTDGAIAIYGTNLAPLTQTPNITGVSGAYVDYESPSQVNVYYSGASSGLHYVTVTTAAGTSNQESFQTTSCVTPQNFRQVGSPTSGGGNLQFHYQWDSPTQNHADLSGCVVGERVDYPGNPFVFPAPFPAFAPQNPTETQVTGSNGELYDTHWVPEGPFRLPYFSNSSTASQVYRWRCACYNGFSWNEISGFTGISINRSINPVGNGTWYYQVEKAGYSAQVTLPQ